MKQCLASLLLLSLFAASTFGQGADIIIRERAKQLRDQNNARQGVPPPAQATKPATPAPGQTPAATPQPAGLARLQTDLLAVKTNATVTAEQQQRLANDLAAIAQGPARPSSAATTKLAANLAAGLSQKSLSQNERSRLVQDLNALLNGASLPKDQTTDLIADVQKIFKGTEHAAAVATDLKSIAGEVQKTASK